MSPTSQPARRTSPPALDHGDLREVFDDVFFVTGTMGMPGPLPVRFSRNMTVVREGERLTIINSVRLSDRGLEQLDKLGKVTDVIRLAGFHGADDAFYKDRYGAKVWAVKGQRYTAGFDSKAKETYFDADVEAEASTTLPIANASLYVFGSKPPEGLLLLARNGGIVVAGDCLQHWHKTDAYFSLFGGLMMRFMGFIKPHNVGPGWLKAAKPPAPHLEGILELDFENVLPAHGAPVIGGAKASFRPAIEKASAFRARPPS